MRPRALLAGLALAAVAASLAAQEAPPEPGAAPSVVVVESGTGTLAVAGETLPLAYIVTPAGPLVALEAIVARLGGSLAPGALGASYALAIGDASFVVAPDSPSLTSGTEILPLSQPARVVDGSVRVPVDLLTRTFGATLGVEFAWDAAAHRLTASRPAVRELPVDVDIVHVSGISTIVLRFPERPRYHLAREANVFDVRIAGDKLVPPAARPKPADPLVRSISIAPDRVRIELAPEADADSYTLEQPFRLVFDVYRASEAKGAHPRPAPPPLEAAPAPARPGVRTVVIDPGHGGTETGAIGPSGTAEKELTLLIATALRARLEEQLKVKAVLTRTEDVTLGLDDRAALANQYKADLFLSVHLNSTVGGNGGDGAETYFLSLQASDARAAQAAEQENAGTAAGGAAGGDDGLRLLLWDLAQSEHLADSQRLATIIQQELNTELNLKDRGVKQAPFRVLMGATMPAVLVELGFISSPTEEKSLRDPAYRGELVEALVRAIGRYKAEVEGGNASATPAGAAGARP